MKHLFSFLAAALIALPMFAGTYTITISGSSTSITSQGISLSADKGSGQTAPVINTNTQSGVTEYRVYAGGTLTVSSSETITGIVFTLSSKGIERQATITPSTGTMSQTKGGNSVSWAGSASSITFSVSAKADFGTKATEAGQFDFTQLVVTTNGEGGGTTGGGTTGGGTTGDVTITGLAYADAYLSDYGDGLYFLDIDLYKGWDDETGYMYPEVYLSMQANSLTAIAGTYNLLYGGYWTSANDSVETDYEALSVGTLTITYANGVYTFNGSFTCTDGKTYKFTCTPDVEAYDDFYDPITLNENGGPAPTGDAISVAEALTIGNALADNASTAETYVVEGYVAKLMGTYNTQYGSQTFFMDSVPGDGTGHYDFEAYQCTLAAPGVALGDKVRVTGKILKYVSGSGNTTIEIKQGSVEILSHTAVEELHAKVSASKRIEAGRMVIYQGNRRFTSTGIEF